MEDWQVGGGHREDKKGQAQRVPKAVLQIGTVRLFESAVVAPLCRRSPKKSPSMNPSESNLIQAADDRQQSIVGG